MSDSIDGNAKVAECVIDATSKVNKPDLLFMGEVRGAMVGS